MFVEGGACAMAQWPVQACGIVEFNVPVQYRSFRRRGRCDRQIYNFQVSSFLRTYVYLSIFFTYVIQK